MPEAAGEHWAQTVLRLALRTQGRALLTLRMFNPDMAGLAHRSPAATCCRAWATRAPMSCR